MLIAYCKLNSFGVLHKDYKAIVERKNVRFGEMKTAIDCTTEENHIEFKITDICVIFENTTFKDRNSNPNIASRYCKEEECPSPHSCEKENDR